ncbi:MAG: hypothetical protein QOJ67_2911 [Acidimicrobiaceae bacterium]
MSGVRGATATPVEAPTPPDPDDPLRTERSTLLSRDGFVIGGLLAVLSLPLVVATAVMSRDRWFPVLDLAMTELRLRDVGGSHTPLIGLPGRIGRTLAEQGSHPGPISFYGLTPLYRLFGSSAWAMLAATVVLGVLAMAVALIVAHRRGGIPLVLAVAAMLAVLTHGYGIGALTQPWNPYLPLLWWIVLLLAVWSVACGDLPMLPVAVFAACWCAQTHIPYLGLSGGLGALVLVLVVIAYRAAAGDPDRRRAVVRWTLASVALGGVLWLPPVIDQAVHSPGNLQQLYDHFSDPPEVPVGLRRGVELELLHLDPTGFAHASGGADGSLVDASSDPQGSTLPGLLVLGVWAAAVVIAWRMRHSALLRLHLVVGVSILLAVVAMSRIFGKVWFYLMLWSWGITAMLLLAVGWTAVAAVAPRMAPERRERARSRGLAFLAAATIVVAGSFTIDGAQAEAPAPRLSSSLGALLPGTERALDRQGHYLVTWTDAFYFGSQGFGLVSELERDGFDARVGAGSGIPTTKHRVIDPREATAEVRLTTGQNIEQTRAVPGAVEAALIDLRTPAERAEFDRLRAEVIAVLDGQGLYDIVPIIDANLFGASIDERVDSDTQRKMARMLDLGEPEAVFILPPAVSP